MLTILFSRQILLKFIDVSSLFLQKKQKMNTKEIKQSKNIDFFLQNSSVDGLPRACIIKRIHLSTEFGRT
jgi:hypothetical protein